MKIALVIVLSFLVIGCGKHENAGSRDSLFVQPMKDSSAHSTSDNLQSSLWIDSSVIRQQADMNALKRFEPTRVVAIYDAYRSLRNSSTK
jgi:hypothetical protein